MTASTNTAGVKVVPVEPTEAMLDAMFAAYAGSEGSYRESWRAALAAAPEAPQPYERCDLRVSVQNAVARSMAEDEQWLELSGPSRAVLMLQICRRVTEAVTAAPGSSPAETGEVSEAAQWRENVAALLDTPDPDVIRVHEGGGPEDLIMSLVVTMAKTRKSRDAALAQPVSPSEAVAWRWRFDDAATWSFGPDKPTGFRFDEPTEVQPLYAQAPDQSATERMRAAQIELGMASGGLAQLPSDFADLEAAWPVSKRGSRASRAYGSIKQRVEAITACVSDARAALGEA